MQTITLTWPYSKGLGHGALHKTLQKQPIISKFSEQFSVQLLHFVVYFELSENLFILIQHWNIVLTCKMFRISRDIAVLKST